jgi:hypothetical protein
MCQCKNQSFRYSVSNYPNFKCTVTCYVIGMKSCCDALSSDFFTSLSNQKIPFWYYLFKIPNVNFNTVDIKTQVIKQIVFAKLWSHISSQLDGLENEYMHNAMTFLIIWQDALLNITFTAQHMYWSFFS